MILVAVGGVVDEVTITEGPDPTGCTKPLCQPAYGSSSPENVELALMTAMAGFAGELMLTGKSNRVGAGATPESGAKGTDFYQVRSTLREAQKRGAIAGQTAAARAAAKRLVAELKARRGQVEAVAAALEHKGRLSGAEVLSVMNPAAP